MELNLTNEKLPRFTEVQRRQPRASTWGGDGKAGEDVTGTICRDRPRHS